MALVALFVVALLMVNLTPNTATAAVSGDYQYRLIDDDTHAEITKYTGSGTVVNIPSALEGKPVTSLAQYAFSYATITSVTMPDSLVRIGGGVFVYCASLTSVQLANVVNIDTDAFQGCTSLTSIDIPTSTVSISYSAFTRCSSMTAINVAAGNLFYASVDGVLYNKDISYLQSMPAGKTGAFAVPASVRDIGSYAFAYSSLSSVSIPAGVRAIYGTVFMNCLSLTAINVDPANANFASIDGALCDKARTNLIALPGGWSGEYTVPESITSIGDFALGACAKLTNVHMGGNLTQIGNRAFRFCSLLVDITVPENVTLMGPQPFYGCPSMLNIYVDSTNPAFKSEGGLLCSKDGTVLLEVPGGRAGSLVLPSGLVTIDPYAAAYCQLLDETIVPEGVVTIADYAFSSCYRLRNVTLPDSLTGLGIAAFSQCAALTSVTIPRNVIAINNMAFYSCGGLVRVQFEGDAPVCGTNVFYSTNAAMAIYYHPGASGFTNPWQGKPCYAMAAPDAPQYLVAETGSAQVQLNWSAPGSTISAPLTGYDIFYGQNSPSTYFGSVGPSILKINVTGLNAGTKYYFTVKAVNAYGSSEGSAVANATTMVPPGAPTGLSITSGNTQLWLTWMAPLDNGRGTIDYYIVYQNGTDVAHAPVCYATFTGLTNGATYRFTVAAHNAAGEGPTSAEANGTPATVPGAPTGLVAAQSVGEVLLDWSAPLNNGGAALDYYVVYQDGTDVAHAAGLSIRLAGLTNGMTYRFNVSAHNPQGEGPWSSGVEATPMAVAPSAPRNVTAVPGVVKVTITWTAPNSTGGSPVTAYRIYRTDVDLLPGDQGTPVGDLIATVGAGVFSLVDGNVTAGVSYIYFVTANNAAGQSAGAASGTVTPQASGNADNTMLFIVIAIVIILVVAMALIWLRRRA
jgi:chitodextrinase